MNDEDRVEVRHVGREVHVPAVNGSVEPFVNAAGTITLSEWIDDDGPDLVLTLAQARLLAARLRELAGA
jgi:hypothetical protein